MPDNGFICNRLGGGHKFATRDCAACATLPVDVFETIESMAGRIADDVSDPEQHRRVLRTARRYLTAIYHIAGDQDD